MRGKEAILPKFNMYKMTRKPNHAKFQQTFICEFYDKQEAVIISHFTSYIGRKKKTKKSPTFLKIHLDQFLRYVCCLFFLFFISFKMHLYVQRKCSSVVYKGRELHTSTATWFRSAVDIQLFSKKTKKDSGSTNLSFFIQAAIQGDTFSLLCTHFICLSLHSPFIQETSVIKKRQE